MPFFHVGRQRIITETFLVEAATLAEARTKELEQERLMFVSKGDINADSITAIPYEGLNCEEGEKVFDVEVEERHNQSVLIVAKSAEEATAKVMDGDGDYLYETKSQETAESSQWTVRDLTGEWIG